jgi:hypothetical protein
LGLGSQSLGCNASKIIRFDLMFVWYESVLGRRCHNMAFKKVHAAEAGGWAHDQFSVCLTANMVTSDKHIYLRMTQNPRHGNSQAFETIKQPLPPRTYCRGLLRCLEYSRSLGRTVRCLVFTYAAMHVEGAAETAFRTLRPLCGPLGSS